MRPFAWLFVLALFAMPPAAAPPARTIVVVAANQSFNWAGYTQGILEKGTSFHGIAGDWVIPKAKQRNKGEAEHSSSWIGIGGGCLDAACTLSDATLIQAGVQHDVDASGAPSYYAWWEAIPGPLIRVDLSAPVGAGDLVRVRIAEDPQVPELWTISIADVSTGGAFSMTPP